MPTYSSSLLEQISAMRRQGIRYKQIASELNLTERQVTRYVSRAIESGMLPERKAPWHDLNNPRTKKLIEMVQGKVSQKDIGKAFGFSRSRASHIVALLKDLHGDDVFDK